MEAICELCAGPYWLDDPHGSRWPEELVKSDPQGHGVWWEILQRICGPCQEKKRGDAEARRALAHLIKDKDCYPEKPRSSSSQWLKRASAEAMYAIEHPDIFWNLDIQWIQVFVFAGASNHWSAWQLASRPSSSSGPYALVESNGYGKQRQELWAGQEEHHHMHHMTEILQSLWSP